MKTKELINIFEKKLNKKISKFSSGEWHKISQSQDPHLTEDFIREFKDKMDWYYVSFRQILSEKFIREFKNEIYWYNISSDQVLSGEFIEEFKYRVNQLYLSKHNRINYLKYKLKSGKISNEEYLKELIKNGGS